MTITAEFGNTITIKRKIRTSTTYTTIAQKKSLWLSFPVKQGSMSVQFYPTENASLDQQHQKVAKQSKCVRMTSQHLNSDTAPRRKDCTCNINNRSIVREQMACQEGSQSSCKESTHQCFSTVEEIGGKQHLKHSQSFIIFTKICSAHELIN